MAGSIVLFIGDDTAGDAGLWVSNDGTGAGTSEVTGISGANTSGLFSGSFVADLAGFNTEVVFNAFDTAGTLGLWVSNGTAAGTFELTGISGANTSGFFGSLENPDFTVSNGEVFFSAEDTAGHGGLWASNGTAAGTFEMTGIGAYTGGIFDLNGDPWFAAFNGEVLFEGRNSAGRYGLWVSNGTAAGTHELTGINGADPFGIGPLGMAAFNGEVLFLGQDSTQKLGLWVSNGTAAGTSELTGVGLNANLEDVPQFTPLNGEAVFAGVDTAGKSGLWVTDGTAAGTHELTGIGGAYTNGIFAGINGSGFFPSFTVFNGEVLFAGRNTAAKIGLWATDGTAAGTHELTGIGGAYTGGLFAGLNPDFAVFDGEVLFVGRDTAGKFGLWATNGTGAGTFEVTGISGASTGSGLSPESFAVMNLPAPEVGNLATGVTFTENGSAVTLAPSATITDANSTTLVSATVSITGGSFAGDTLLVSGQTSGTVIGGTGITPTFTGNGLVTFSGTDTLADYQSALELVTFNNNAENPADFGSDPTRTLTWTLNDGTGTISGASEVGSTTSTIGVANINDAPTLANLAPSANWTEENPDVTLTHAVTITDPDDANLSGATVAITGGTFGGDGDELSVVAGGTSISATYDSTSETLTLSGIDTLAHYQTVLDSISFNAGENPTDFGSNPTRTLTWTVMDPSGTANGGVNVSAPLTSAVTITNVNDPPILSLGTMQASWTEEQGQPTTLSPSLTVTDPDGFDVVSATVKITGGTFAGDGDTFAIGGAGSGSVGAISFSYNSSNETLTLTGTDTLAHYQAVLESVTFNAGENPTDFASNPARTVVWTLNDGGGTANFGSQVSTPVTSTIVIANVNDPPTLANVTPSISFTEEHGPVTLAGLPSITDSDDVNLAGATVKIAGGTFAGDTDTLSANTSGTSITANYDSSTETLTLTGADTLAHYRTVLETVAFNAGENPTDFGSNPTRTLTWTVNDGSGTANGGVQVSTPVTSTISITNVNDPPTLSNVAASVRLVTGTVSPSLTVSDPDNLGLASATVAITGGGFAGDNDVLEATTTGTAITASYNSVTQTLTLTGSDTLAHYQSVLDSVIFAAGSNPTNAGSNPTRTLSWVVNDGTLASTTGVTTITIGGLPRNDFNGDGKSDVLWQNADGLPAIWEMNGTSLIGAGGLPDPGPSWQIEASADFNRDGRADIILQNTDGLPVIWEMNGTSIIGGGALPNPGSSWHVIATGDFNADGNPDILWQNTDGSAMIWYMNGTSMVGGGTLPDPGPSWHVIGTGDFTGVGESDILLQNTDGLPVIWEMNGTSIIGGGALPDPGASWHIIGTGDFNGDGKSDILLQNTDGLAVMWEMNGTSIIGGGALPNPGPSWHAIGTSDFNGDAKADILWQNADGLPVIWEMNGTSIIGAAALPNPGPTWHPKDDGPIPLDQMTSNATPGQPALHLSAADASNNTPAANTSVIGVNNTFAGASLAMPPAGSASGSPGPFAFSLAPPAGVSPQFAAVWTSLIDSPTAQSFQKLFTGGS